MASAIARFPCSGCGAGLIYDPPTGGLHCPACGLQQGITAGAEGSVGEHDFAAAAATEGPPLPPTAVEVACSSCGASFTFEPPQVSGACVRFAPPGS